MNDVAKQATRMVVSVRYLGANRNELSNNYDYFDQLGVMPGDYVLVAAGHEETIKIALVVDRFELPKSGSLAGRSVIANVNEPLAAYFKAIDLRAERAAALKRLEQIDKRHKSVERYERLAEVDPEAAELLAMLKATQGQVLDEYVPDTEELTARAKRKGVQPMKLINADSRAIDGRRYPWDV